MKIFILILIIDNNNINDIDNINDMFVGKDVVNMFIMMNFILFWYLGGWKNNNVIAIIYISLCNGYFFI